MKKLFIAIAMCAIVALISLPASAANGWSGAPGSSAGTLYQQEGNSGDGPAPIDASNRGPGGSTATGADSMTNWQYQYGDLSWYRGVYTATTGWLEESSDGDMSLEIECDIEMYIYEWIQNHKIYFHIGNPFTATTSDKTAYVQLGFASNNGMYIGFSFDSEKTFDPVDGKLVGAMKSERTMYKAQDESFDLLLEMSEDGGTTYRKADSYGEGAHGTITDTIWWKINSGAPGTYNLLCRVRLLIDEYQPDGDYYLDPVLVTTPAL